MDSRVNLIVMLWFRLSVTWGKKKEILVGAFEMEPMIMSFKAEYSKQYAMAGSVMYLLVVEFAAQKIIGTLQLLMVQQCIVGLFQLALCLKIFSLACSNSANLAVNLCTFL